MKSTANFTSNIGKTVVLHYPAVLRVKEFNTVYETVIGTLKDSSGIGIWITVSGQLQFHPWTYIVKLEFPSYVQE